MTTKFRPLLAVACEDITKLHYPVMCSLKLDGLRSIVLGGVVYSRSMKPIPSAAVQTLFGKEEYEGFDGELIYGDVYAENVFNLSTSFCMSKNVPDALNADEISFFVFDCVQDAPYTERISCALKATGKGVVPLPPVLINTPEELIEFEEGVLLKGGEGVMVRSLDGPYKQGRSTLKEGYLLKIKRFVDEEAVITGFDEKMHNTNEAKKDALGYTERSTSREGMVGANTLGALVVHSEKWGEFRIGTGFDDKLRKEIWENRLEYLSGLAKFKYFATGVKISPRFPVFLGFRHEDDM